MNSNKDSRESSFTQSSSGIEILADLAKFSMANLLNFQYKMFETLCFSTPWEDVNSETYSELLELLKPNSKNN